MDIVIDGLEVTFPNDESATWLTRRQIQSLTRDGLVEVNGEVVTPEDGPFRVLPDDDAIASRGGPGSGYYDPHYGRPGETGGSMPRGTVGVGLTPNRPGKAAVEVQREINRYGAEIKKIGDVRTFGYASGVYKGNDEPSINMEYVGNGDMLESIRTKAREWQQDSAIVYGPDLPVGKDSAAGTIAFSTPPDGATRDKIGEVMMQNGVDGWTWAEVNGKPSLVVVGIPQFGVTPRVYEKTIRALTAFLDRNTIEHRLNERRLKVAVATKDTDYQWH